MNLRFTKMQGLGNDFVVIDAIHQQVELSPEQLRHIADRHRGIGCDQILFVEHSDRDDVDFRYRIFNQDGGEVEQCGNGARCFVRYVVDKGLTDQREIAVETPAGIIFPRLEDNGEVSVDMGVPVFEPARIPFEADRVEDCYSLKINENSLEIGVVSMGNPHAVLLVDAVDTAPVSSWGPLLESHPRFPQRVNAGFMEIVGKDNIKLRVFERGVGETLACGTGACAAVVIAHQWGLVTETVAVDLPGGRLRVSWSAPGRPVIMTGPAETVFEGSIQVS